MDQVSSGLSKLQRFYRHGGGGGGGEPPAFQNSKKARLTGRIALTEVNKKYFLKSDFEYMLEVLIFLQVQYLFLNMFIFVSKYVWY